MKKITALENNQAHYAKLLTALGGTGIGWYYNGECLDAGRPTAHCVCGHPVRYLFTLDKEGHKSIQVGSTCVCTAPGLNPNVLVNIEQRMAEFRKEEADRKRKAKEATRAEEVATLIEQIKPVYKCVYSWKKANDKYWLPRDVFMFRLFPATHVLDPALFGYKTSAGLINRLKLELRSLQAVKQTIVDTPPQPRTYRSTNTSWNNNIHNARRGW